MGRSNCDFLLEMSVLTVDSLRVVDIAGVKLVFVEGFDVSLSSSQEVGENSFVSQIGIGSSQEYGRESRRFVSFSSA